jgi:hypothetical protein
MSCFSESKVVSGIGTLDSSIISVDCFGCVGTETLCRLSCVGTPLDRNYIGSFSVLSNGRYGTNRWRIATYFSCYSNLS